MSLVSPQTTMIVIEQLILAGFRRDFDPEETLLAQGVFGTLIGIIDSLNLKTFKTCFLEGN